ncbi:hypothetical protein PZT66_23595 [Pseudomonas aeruginosa]|uniref:hypothetical protein n=1 Tax=Pseudomonas aeruginosa TaxID=287 RepID=UPI0003BB1B9A|nr:hypothetical protein [Pseudomonas aeruginosa]ELD5772940.1 hypothetical protein [Pseudomonas aeruginosa]ERW61237.1 hypothetical protein Q024_06284 [Pseudomonas aeruginosa BWHPSA011]ETV28710.1 hypothetical protein Q046_05627 [Pseudomonas aeruginosa BWHPSA041]ETV56023.1 hypothetical protein Q042_05432 [Pseudomonas aeruginosa BWHPSA037]MBA5210275.1 hypothetical protein [Pseudomonas aeruginosa]
MSRSSNLRRSLGAMLDRLGLDDPSRPRATRTMLANRVFYLGVLMEKVGHADLAVGQRVLVCRASGEYLFAMQRRPVALRASTVALGKEMDLQRGIQQLELKGIHFGLSPTFRLAARKILHDPGFAEMLLALGVKSDQCVLLKELARITVGEYVQGLCSHSPLRMQAERSGRLSVAEDRELTRQWRGWLACEKKAEATRSLSDWARHGFAVGVDGSMPYLFRSNDGLTFTVTAQDDADSLPGINDHGRLSVFVDRDHKYVGGYRDFCGLPDLERQIVAWARELKSQFLKGPGSR